MEHPLASLATKVLNRGVFETLFKHLLELRAQGLISTTDYVAYAERALEERDPIFTAALATLSERVDDLEGGTPALPPLHIPEVCPGDNPISTCKDEPDETGPRCSRNVIQNVESALLLKDGDWDGTQFHVYQSEGTTGYTDVLPTQTWPVAQPVPEPPLKLQQGKTIIGASLDVGTFTIKFTEQLAPNRRRAAKISRGPGTHIPSDYGKIQHISPKIDGVFFLLKIDDEVATIVDRNGAGWKGTAPGIRKARVGLEYYEKGKSKPIHDQGDLMKLLSFEGSTPPCTSGCAGNDYFFVLWVDIWQIPNIWGWPFHDIFKKTMRSCTIQFDSNPPIRTVFSDWKGGTDWDEWDGFVPTCDGLILHSGTMQYWAKFRPSVDVDQETWEWMKKFFRLDIQPWDDHNGKIQEFERISPFTYQFVRSRPDKDRPNSKQGIMKVMMSTDAFDVHSELVESGLSLATFMF